MKADIEQAFKAIHETISIVCVCGVHPAITAAFDAIRAHIEELEAENERLRHRLQSIYRDTDDLIDDVIRPLGLAIYSSDTPFVAKGNPRGSLNASILNMAAEIAKLREGDTPNASPAQKEHPVLIENINPFQPNSAAYIWPDGRYLEVHDVLKETTKHLAAIRSALSILGDDEPVELAGLAGKVIEELARWVPADECANRSGYSLSPCAKCDNIKDGVVTDRQVCISAKVSAGVCAVTRKAALDAVKGCSNAE
jgi:hypothetical protein